MRKPSYSEKWEGPSRYGYEAAEKALDAGHAGAEGRPCEKAIQRPHISELVRKWNKTYADLQDETPDDLPTNYKTRTRKAEMAALVDRYSRDFMPAETTEGQEFLEKYESPASKSPEKHEKQGPPSKAAPRVSVTVGMPSAATVATAQPVLRSRSFSPMPHVNAHRGSVSTLWDSQRQLQPVRESTPMQFLDPQAQLPV